MKIIEGGVTAAKGFEAASTAAKIKYQDRTDMAMISVSYTHLAAFETRRRNIHWIFL